MVKAVLIAAVIVIGVISMVFLYCKWAIAYAWARYILSRAATVALAMIIPFVRAIATVSVAAIAYARIVLQPAIALILEVLNLFQIGMMRIMVLTG